MSAEREAARARLVNLLLPGGGLIVLGRMWLGVVIGLAFIVFANFALAATFLFPDDLEEWHRTLGIGLAGGTYLGAQLRLAQTVRLRRRQADESRRREALAAVRTYLRAGQCAEAWRAIQPLASLGEHDLLVAYRVAQVLTAKRDVPAALAAWKQVRRLDRHRIYSQETDSSARSLSRMLAHDDSRGPTIDWYA